MSLRYPSDHQIQCSCHIGRCFYYLSGIHRKRGDIESAKAELTRCLEIRQKLMPLHHHTGFTYHQMGLLMQMAGDHQNAMSVSPFPLLKDKE